MRVNAMLATHDIPEEAMPWMDEIREIFDELVIFIDAKRAAPDAEARAEKVGSRVHRHKADSWYEWDLGSMARACESDWVFIIERDEQLSAEWRQPEWRQILESTHLTHFWIPRRWVVACGRYISAYPWWPDSQLRLIRNNVSGSVFPTRLHDTIHVPGPGAHFLNLALHHHVLWMCSREIREKRMQYYDTLRPGGALEYYYLYEDHAPPQAELPQVAKVNIDREVVSMGKLPSEKLAKLSFEVSGVPREVNASLMFWIDAKLINRTDEIIYPARPYPVHLSYHWLEKSTRTMVVFEGIRSGLFPGLEAKSTGQYNMTILAPEQPGEYILQTTMVQDGVSWFENVRPDIIQEFAVSVRAGKPRKL
jgi:hypothetical protein